MTSISVNAVVGVFLAIALGVAAIRIFWLFLGFMWRNALALVFGASVCIMVLNSGEGPESILSEMRHAFHQSFVATVHSRGHRLTSDPPEIEQVTPEVPEAASDSTSVPASNTPASDTHRILIDPKPGTYTFDMTQLRDDEQGAPANMNNPGYGYGIQ